jgi:transcriptional regulator of acetoin/glycerol metabolism
VDAAGYLHEREAELPELLVPLASAEPESTLRSEVLDSLVVRRPDLRPLSKWMNDGGALLVTLVESDGEKDGALVVPRESRAGTEPLALEEVRALKAVADRLAAACRARAASARLLARAHEATQRAEAAEEAMDRLRHERALDVGRDALAATRLAGPATVGVYAASSRMALEALERRTSVGAPIAVVAPSGVDPVPFLARAHLAGARREAPLVLVDATSAREHDVARWVDSQASPLALADRGMLVLLDGAALPFEIQRLVAAALAQKRSPWERPDPLDVQLALTGAAAPDVLVEQTRLDSTLALRLGDARSAPVSLPRLRDRPEDLRAILTDRLAREGLRAWGRPVGIEPAAYARLIEYPFPGEDAELAAVVQRLVARCRGEVVSAADVDALRPTLSAPMGSGAAKDKVTAIGLAGSKEKPGRARRKDPSSV